MGLWDAKDPILYRQSAHRWRQGCEPYAPAELYSLEALFFCYDTHFRWRLSKPQDLVPSEGLGKLKKNSFTSSGLETVTFRFEAYCLNH
jgi:hypothetical protein